ncbi:hypothetical protein I4U23_006790 [Adineta vaga]|nr:hypothetical protein I4U23_006790 [Adineta vaga]
MSFTLRSTSTSSIDHERLTRKRQAAAVAAAAASSSTILNRFLSFNENQSSSVESRHRLLQSTPNLIELLEDDDDDIDDYQALCHECNTCSKVFASEYGLNHHISMHHPNQSILCAICNITFRSHRSLKTHQQRRHSTAQNKLKSNQTLVPNYSYISSYLVLAFSSKQFPLMAKVACEQQRLPLGCFSSKLYQCQFCSISFPCSRTLHYHVLDQHEQYEYKICQNILSDMMNQVEYDLRTVQDDDNDDDEIESMKLSLAKQASQFGLVNKQLAGKYRETKTKQNQQIHPRCQHLNRTCANLCLQYLSSYSELIKTYSYTIPIIPKGNPFAQGSIVSPINHIHSNGSSSINDPNVSNELVNGRQKRKSIKQPDESSSPQNKKKPVTNRISSNNKVTVGKQPVEPITKTNEAKSASVDQSTSPVTGSTASSVPRRILPKDNYTRSSSISSNSSTSTRSSANLVRKQVHLLNVHPDGVYHRQLLYH